MKKIAIIPARGGRKRIPQKNIQLFLGRPIIEYSIETALQSGLFNEVMVSTNDNEIAEVSKIAGAQVLFCELKKLQTILRLLLMWLKKSYLRELLKINDTSFRTCFGI